jgi:hypothetical protein
MLLYDRVGTFPLMLKNFRQKLQILLEACLEAVIGQMETIRILFC